MIFYQIQDKRSGLWYQQGYLEWRLSIQTNAFVCCTLHAAQAALDTIIACHVKRGVEFSRDEVELVPIDTEVGIKILRDLFAIRDLGDFHDEIRDAELGAIEDGEMERAGDTCRWCDAVERARELLKE
jgi:hypothetical protein